ncbi:MAG: hypothetical protein KGO81_04190 [Bacteroidota bacterium]|nr:hypothetical protein [Bacteroidota bacterium]
MKYSLLGLVFFCNQAYTQMSSSGLASEFKEMAGVGKRQSGFEGMQAFGTGKILGTQFLGEGWSKGMLVTFHNDTLQNKLLFLFDKVKQEVYMKKEGSEDIFVADKQQLKEFFILSVTKKIRFINAGVFQPELAGQLLMAMHSDQDSILTTISLFKKVNAEFQKYDPENMELVKAGMMNDAFIDKPLYYFLENNRFSNPFKLNKTNILKAISDKKIKAKAWEYFNQNDNLEIDEQFMLGLIKYIN